VLTVLILLALAQDSSPTQHSALSTQHSEITVTATRKQTRLSDTPASVVVLSREMLGNTAAATVDDALRQVPGFTLFRRAGSRTANPTTQGVSLRGIGASGASRALVLDDGVPLNDPFGGWVYWGRMPGVAIDRVEIVRGGASDLYGSGAMSGVVQFIRRSDDAVAADVSYGQQSTANGQLYAATKRGPWRASVASDVFQTDGYVLVQPSQRGAVDTAADSRHTSVDLTVARGGLFARASHYEESRHNGTPLQTNDTTIRQLTVGADLPALSLRAYTSGQDYAQTFSAITADRSSERLTVDQRVPSGVVGASAQWFAFTGERHVIITGADARRVHGDDDEGTTHVSGTQRTGAAYVEDVMTLGPRLSATAALRVDRWKDTAWSPRATLLFRASDHLAFTAAAYRAFRAPTLNELIRTFRVGNVVTLANDQLGPERLSAIEAGVRSGPFRLTLFSMTTTDTIANVTLTSTPALITRQRQNFGSSRSRGAELDFEQRLGARWTIDAGWLATDARLSTGKRPPQVPRNQATLQVRFNTVGAQLRWSSMQFDDDLNQLALRGYFVADVFASMPFASHVDGIVAVENLFDRRVETAATPVITLGQPRAIRVGLRFRSAAAKLPL
jgi:outer membrane receptor protein involved in Fe transport